MPNILLIVLESTRASHLSCYGYDRPTTPYLDQLAAEGVLYEQAISPASWTLPAHSCLFTGLYTSQHGTDFDQPQLNPQIMTLAEMLQQRGYCTAAFSTNPWVNQKLGFSRGFQTFRWAKRTLEWLSPLIPTETKIEKVIRYALDFWRPLSLRNNHLLQKWIAEAQSHRQPFFAYTLYFDPHYPLRPRPPYAAQFLGERYKRWWRVNKDPDRYMAGAVQMTHEDFEILKGLYDSRLASMDAILGQFVDFLRRTGLLDNTLLFVVADHGENLGEHALMSHQYCVYETLIHVPLIIRYPPLFPAGLRISPQVQTLEIFTTIMDVVGIERQEIVNHVSGRSLVPAKLVDNPLPFAISEYLVPNLDRMQRLYPHKDLSHYKRALRAIRREGYKYIWTSDGQPELYDLTIDSGETNNLVNQKTPLAKELQAQLDKWLTSIQKLSPAQQPAANIDDAVVTQRLRDLGYL